MRTIHVANLFAGKGKADEHLQMNENDELYHSKGEGDITKFVRETINASDEVIRFVVYGGDGSINEAVNGIMTSKNPNLAKLKMVASGSGNDFVKMLTTFKGEQKIDIIKINDKYAVNMINIGFDCNVVFTTNKFKRKPWISGSFAYILGVVSVLFGKLGEEFKIHITDVDGKEHSFTEGKYLLCCICNGQYCGGGFKASPLSVISDGYLEVLVVKKVSKLKFVSLVSRYRAGTHINYESSEPEQAFKDYMSYIKFTKMTISGTKNICADGEVSPAESSTIEVVPNAITIYND